MPMSSVYNLNVSPYLSSALSRLQSNEQAAAPKSPAQSSSSKAAPGGVGEAKAQVLSDQTLGALVAMQAASDEA